MRTKSIYCFLVVVIAFMGCIDIKPDLLVIEGVVYEVNTDNTIDPLAGVSVRASYGPPVISASTEDLTDMNGKFQIEWRVFSFNSESLDLDRFWFNSLDSCVEVSDLLYDCYMKVLPSRVNFVAQNSLNEADSIVLDINGGGENDYNDTFHFIKKTDSQTEELFWEIQSDRLGTRVAKSLDDARLKVEVTAGLPFSYAYRVFSNSNSVFESMDSPEIEKATVLNIEFSGG